MTARGGAVKDLGRATAGATPAFPSGGRGTAAAVDEVFPPAGDLVGNRRAILESPLRCRRIPCFRRGASRSARTLPFRLNGRGPSRTPAPTAIGAPFPHKNSPAAKDLHFFARCCIIIEDDGVATPTRFVFAGQAPHFEVFSTAALRHADRAPRQKDVCLPPAATVTPIGRTSEKAPENRWGYYVHFRVCFSK